jgi:LPXTG-motif cell wall-anchored protein
MKQRARTMTMMVLTMFAALAMSATAASAQEPYPPAEGDLSLSCTDADAGDTSQCNVTGAIAGETLVLSASVDADVFFTDTTTADDDGEASFAVDIPADVSGEVLITVTGSESGETATETIVVTADDDDEATPVSPTPSPGDRLPMTGSEVSVLLTAGIALLGGGLLLLRRREDAKVTARA